MSDLSNRSTEELQAELELRKKGKQLKPVLLSQPDFSNLKETCAHYLEFVERGESDDHAGHYVFEAAMEAFYGAAIWDYVNEMLG